MTLRRRSYPLAFPLLACGLLAQVAPNPPAAASTTEETIVLSPFIITETDDQGYAATSTLAGTRLRTELRDLGSAISVVTPEFLADVGAVDQGTLLSYTTNTETGGVQGNFSGVGDNQGRPGPGFSRTDPQANQRIRGLDRATNTRNYFITDVGFDEYNTSRVTINRGPNSLLFGLGSPGGIIDQSLKMPMQRDMTELKFRIGDRGTHRTTFDVNQVIVKDRLAIRMAGLYEETNYKQRPAFEIDRRFYAAVDAKIRTKTQGIIGQNSLRMNYEAGRFGGTPPSPLPPGDGFSSWWQGLSRDVEQYTGQALPSRFVQGEDFVPKATINNIQTNAVTTTFFNTPYFIALALPYASSDAQAPGFGSTNAALAAVDGGQGRIPVRPGRVLMDQRWSGNYYRQPQLTGFSGAVIQDRNIFDYRNKLISGNLDEVENEFRAYNFTFDQQLFSGRGGFEVAYDYQERDLVNDLGFGSGSGNSGDNYDVYIDMSQFTSNDQPNPNVGRAVMKNQPAGLINRRLNEREALRATAFYELDFKRHFDRGIGRWLGRHVFTGLWTKQSLESENLQNALVWDSNSLNARAILNNGGVDTANRQVVTTVYLSDSLLNSTSASDLRITDYIRIPKIKAGDEFTMFYYDATDRLIKNGQFYARDVVRSGNLTRNEVTAEAFSVQSFFFDGKLVGLAGWRTDDVKAYERAGSFRLPDGEWDVARNQVLQSTPSFVGSGDTFTWSVVGHYPDDLLPALPFGLRLSAHYNESENFDSQAQRRNLRGVEIAPPTGVTKEYGFSIESRNRRLGARFNWFETSGTLKTNSSASTPMNRIFFWATDWLNRASDAEKLGFTVQEIPGMPASITSYAQFYNAIREIFPSDVYAQFNVVQDGAGVYRGENIQGLADTSDTIAKGFEIELVGSPMRNLNLSFNVAKQETIESNSAPVLIAVADQIRANIERLGIANTYDSFSRGETNTFFNRMRGDVFSPIAGIRARDGTVSQEQRKWRANAVATYRHTDGGLKGIGYGAAARWQDKVATGYPTAVDESGNQVPLLDRPYFGPTQLSGDLWASYERKLKYFGGVDWKIQLNVRNAFGDRGDIPTITNPDGKVAVIRIENPTEWFVTNTFRF